MTSFESAVASAIALGALSGCFVLVRFVARIAFVKHVGPDDGLIVLAWGAAVALAVVAHQQSNDNVSSRSSSSSSSSSEAGSGMTTLLKQLWSSNLTYNLAVLLLKDSLLLQYLRFSKDIGYRRACWALGAIITIYGVTAFFVGIFSCQPINFSWNNKVSGGRCINFLAFWLFNASFNSATDIIVFVLPIPVLRALQLPRQQLCILSCIFVLGLFVCIASIIRLTAVYSAIVTQKNDPSIAVWSTVEVNVGIICACLPSIRHLLAQASPRILAAFRPRLNFPQHHPPQTPTTVSSSFPQTSEEKKTATFELKACTSDSDAASSHHSPTTWRQSDEEAITPRETPSSPTSVYESTPSSPSISTIRAVDDQPEEEENEREDNDDNTKPLPLPPQPFIPAPATRPSGPRPNTSSSRPQKPQHSRTHSRWRSRSRSRSRTRFDLAIIPEADSKRSSIVQFPDSSLTRNTTATSSSPKSPLRPQGSRPQPSAQTVPPVSTITTPNTTTPYHRIAPWTQQQHLSVAAWSPSSPPSSPERTSTYSYEILGGPRAQARNNTDDAKSPSSPSPPSSPNKGTATTAGGGGSRPKLFGPSSSAITPSKSMRERAAREKERNRRKEREREREEERLQERSRQKRDGERPRGPREMT
ncbi:uncharacterized protein PV06_00849 [Exophiala oligosperma]|uniref:Rhodopsin domain-containing protein n=1 Tax=Exophiala oligosperma TaxID=215243 RepID=A0A0D2CEC0_9EURO|nr:uncharacterized protein PV06_00849 [Exophiala oligosperma]KIW48242.1 hypothetical protein PV06_00849 [Exophiala oligosperma]